MLHPHAQWTGKLQTSLWRVASDGEVTAELHDPDGSKSFSIFYDLTIHFPFAYSCVGT